MIAKYLLFEKKQIQSDEYKIRIMRLRENDCDEHFPKSLFIEDVIFSVAESIQKGNTW